MEILKEVYTVKTDVEADELISQIKEQLEERQRFEMIYKARVEQLTQNYEKQVKTIDSEISFKKSMLQAYFLTLPVKSTKTQSTYKLLSGKLVMKKPTVKLAHEDRLILDWVMTNAPEYVKQEPKLDWTKLKADLEISGDYIVNKASGEILNVDGLRVEHINEVFEIKD